VKDILNRQQHTGSRLGAIIIGIPLQLNQPIFINRRRCIEDTPSSFNRSISHIVNYGFV